MRAHLLNLLHWILKIVYILIVCPMSVFVPRAQMFSAALRIFQRPPPHLPRRPNPIQKRPEPSSAPSSAPCLRSWSSWAASFTTGSGNWPLMLNILSCKTMLGKWCKCILVLVFCQMQLISLTLVTFWVSSFTL